MCVCFFKSGAEEAKINKRRPKKTMQKYLERLKTAKVESKIEDNFTSGRLYARLASSPGK